VTSGFSLPKLSANSRRMIILSAAVVLMAVLLILLNADCSGCAVCGNDASVQEEHDHEHDHAVSGTDSGDELILDKMSDDMVSMTLKNLAGSYTIRRDEESGLLTIDPLSGLPINEDFVENIWYSALTLGYVRAVETEDTVPYGFDRPQAQFTCTYKDGSQIEVCIGNAMPGTNIHYYYTISTRPGWVYATDFSAAFFQGDQYWLSDDIFSGDGTGFGAEIGNINVWGSAFPATLIMEQNNTEDKSDPWYDCDYVIKSPAIAPTDNYNISVLRDELSSITASEALIAYPTEQQITECGLDRPYAVVKHQRGGVWHVLRIARVTHDILCVKADGIEVIYELEADNYPMLSSLSPELLRGTQVHVRRFAAVEEMTFTFSEQFGGERISFRLERVESGNDLYEYYLFRDGEEVNYTTYKSMLEVFNNAAAVSFGDGLTAEQPALTVEIKYFDEFAREREIITYTEAGTRRYRCAINGEGDAIVTEMWLDQLRSAIENIN